MDAKASSPHWSASPGVGLGRAPNIVRLAVGEQRKYVALSHAVVGAVVHWDGRRTVACTEHLGTCPVDHKFTTKRWEGWIAVQAVKGNQLLWLAITEGAAKDHPPLTDPANDLRGRELVCSRAGRGVRGELSIVLGIQLYETTRLISAPNVEEFCRLLWGFPPQDTAFRSQPQTGERPVPILPTDTTAGNGAAADGGALPLGWTARRKASKAREAATAARVAGAEDLFRARHANGELPEGWFPDLPPAQRDADRQAASGKKVRDE